MKEVKFKEFTYKDLENFCRELLSDCQVKRIAGTSLFRIPKGGVVNERSLDMVNDIILKEINKDETIDD